MILLPQSDYWTHLWPLVSWKRSRSPSRNHVIAVWNKFVHCWSNLFTTDFSDDSKQIYFRHSNVITRGQGNCNRYSPLFSYPTNLSIAFTYRPPSHCYSKYSHTVCYGTILSNIAKYCQKSEISLFLDAVIWWWGHNKTQTGENIFWIWRGRNPFFMLIMQGLISYKGKAQYREQILILNKIERRSTFV